MSISVRLLSLTLFLSLVISDYGVTEEKPAATKKTAESGAAAPLSKEVLTFMNVAITLRVKDMSPNLTLAWQLRLAEIPLKVRESKTVAAKKVSLEVVDVPLAGALRILSEKCGCQYRIVKDEIRMAMPDEWAQIDSGKSNFEAIAAP